MHIKNHSKINPYSLEFQPEGESGLRIYYDLHVDFYSPAPHVDVIEITRNFHPVDNEEYERLAYEYYEEICLFEERNLRRV